MKIQRDANYPFFGIRMVKRDFQECNVFLYLSHAKGTSEMGSRCVNSAESHSNKSNNKNSKAYFVFKAARTIPKMKDLDRNAMCSL